MAAFIIPEEAEHGLHETEQALEALHCLLAALGARQLELRAEELAALLALVRRPLAEARGQARFEARA